MCFSFLVYYCDDTFELMLSSYNLGSFICFIFVIISRLFAAQGQMVFFIDQLTNSWATTASSNVHFLHESMLFGVTGIQLTLLVAIFAITSLLFVLFVYYSGDRSRIR